MQIARFTHNDDSPRYAIVEQHDDKTELVVVHGDPLFGEMKTTGERLDLAECRLLAPVIPRSKVVGVGRNYADHAKERGAEVPSEPLLFLKPNTAVIGPDDPIVLPAFSHEVSFEAELAVVIGALCKNVAADDAPSVIAGYTCANDITARDAQRSDNQWFRAKGFDGSCPLGPYLVTDIDPSALRIQCRVNGHTKQDGKTADMVFSVNELVAYISSFTTLLPGDVLLTGTPAGVDLLSPGQRIEVEIDQIGVLSNPVIRR